MFVHSLKSSFPEKIAAMKKKTRTAMDRTRDGHREPHRGLDPDDVDPDEDDVEDAPTTSAGCSTTGCRSIVEQARRRSSCISSAHRADDDGRRDHVLHVLGQAGEEPAPRAHRRACERVRAARVGERRRHLGDRVDEAVVHDRHERGRDEQAAEPAGAQAEVPAVVLAGDDGADTERPQGPDAGVSPQPSFLEVLLTHLLVGDGADLALLSDTPNPTSCRPPLSYSMPGYRATRHLCCQTCEAVDTGYAAFRVKSAIAR